MTPVNPKLLPYLACPVDHEELKSQGDSLTCARGHRYPTYDGVPVLLVNESEATHPAFGQSLRIAAGTASPYSKENNTKFSVDPYVQEQIAATNGNLYLHLINNLREYPIPHLRLPEGNGRRLLDIGCNWGRWSIAAARKGYSVIGLDPNLDAALAARRVADQLQLDIHYIVGDARYLPFRTNSFDYVFSYSVLQHLSKENVALCLKEVSRILNEEGISLIQLPNKLGPRMLYNQLKFKGSDNLFRVRYWSLGEMKSAFERAIGPSSLSVDCYFGLGIQASDLHLLPAKYQLVVRLSEALRNLSQHLPLLVQVADSIYVKSEKHNAPEQS